MTAPQLFTENAPQHGQNLDQLSPKELAKLFSQANFEAAEAVAKANDAIAEAISLVAETFQLGGRLFLSGAGTSGRLAVMEAAECPPTFHSPHEQVQALIAGGQDAFIKAIEGAEDNREAGAAAASGLSDKDLLIGISASGSAPFVRGSVAKAHALGARCLLLSSNPQCREDREYKSTVTVFLIMETGPEVLAGSTRMKAATAAKCCLNAITTGAMAQIGRIYGHHMVEVRPTNRKLKKRATRLIAQLGGVSEERAADLLESSGNDIKVAILRARLGITADQARNKLQASHRHLRELLAS